MAPSLNPIDALPLELLEDPLYFSLKPLDSDGQDDLDFSEVEGEYLPLPNGEDSLFIGTPSDFSIYQNLISTAYQVRGQRQQSLPQHLLHADTMLAQAYEIIKNGPTLAHAAEGEHFYDLFSVWEVEGDYYLLARKRDTRKETSYFFSVRLPSFKQEEDSPHICPMTAEIGGYAFQLADVRSLNLWDEERRPLLAGIFYLLLRPIPGLPEEVRELHKKHVEAMLYRLNPLTALADRREPPKIRTEIQKAFARIANQQERVIIQGPTAQGEVNVEFPPSMTESEKRKAREVLERIPLELYGVLIFNGIAPRLTLEWADKERLHHRVGFPAGGCYLRDEERILLNQELLQHAGARFMEGTVSHELNHTLLPYEEDDSLFIADYYESILIQASEGKEFPGVSIYSFYGISEFVAEDSTSYLAGETDFYPRSDLLFGDRSRAELRKYQPEMYVTSKLLYESDSPFYGQIALFTWASKKVIDQLLADPNLRAFILDPETTAQEIGHLYWEVYQEMIRER